MKKLIEQTTLRVWAEIQLRHNKYERCLANAKAYGNAKVYGNVAVYGVAEVYGDAKICGLNDFVVIKNSWSSGRYFTYTASNKMFKVGCFLRNRRGTHQESIRRRRASMKML